MHSGANVCGDVEASRHVGFVPVRPETPLSVLAAAQQKQKPGVFYGMPP
jgi:hypothetical protein